MSAYPPIDNTAHCRRPGVDPERFTPRQGANGHTVNNTKALCNGGGKIPACPFRDSCREWGVTHAVAGIWGGWAEDERKAERKRRRIKPAALSFARDLALVAPGPAPSERGSHGNWTGVRRHERHKQPLCADCRAFRNAARKAKREEKSAARAAARGDGCALRACDVCGEEMRPSSLPRHRRRKHAETAAVRLERAS